MRLYYPLGLSSKVEHIDFGFIPSKKFCKYKRDLKSNNELGNMFAEMYRGLKNYTVDFHPTSLKKPDLPNIVNVLNTIIPESYFGSHKNQKRIFFIINRILTQSRGEFIHIYTLSEGYDYNDFSWLNRTKHAKYNIKDQVLWANILLLQTVVKPLIRYFYYYVNNLHNREFLVVSNGQLHSFRDRNICRYLKMGYIKKITKEPSRKVPVAGSLWFILKNSLQCLDCRPLLLNSKRNKLPLDKIRKNLKLLSQTYQIGSGKCLYEKWRVLVEYNKNRRKLYAVKLDLIDAFGMVDLDVLKTIIDEDDKFLTDPQKKLLYKIMSDQVVYINGSKQYYQWCHGLLQGTKLSPTLCELYLNYLVFNHLRQFDKPNTLIHRTVDDILFVSTCDSDVYEFELTAMKVFLLNEDKSKTFVNAGEDPHMLFCGKVFNMVTREISNSYAFKKDTELRVKFKFWNPKYQVAPDNAYKFIENSMKFAYVNFCFSRYELNTTCNSADSVLRNIYDGMCFVAFKLDCAVESIGYVFQNLENRCKTVNLVIKFILHSYCPIIKKNTERYKGEKHESIFHFTLLRFIARRAFIVVLQKRMIKYKYVIDDLKTKTKVRFNINNVEYFFTLPKQFKNIKMRRRQKCL